MGLTGNLDTLRQLKRRLVDLPRSVAHDVSQRAAPALTELTRDAFDAGRSVYGGSRPAGVDGQALSLRKTGDTARLLRFSANGTVVRCVLGPKYAKYLIGKYDILPNGALPAAWSAALRDLVASTKAAL
jgi:hypothetical protein